MVTKVELYDAFGELIYAVAKADGVIQASEISALNEIIDNHPWSSEIKWSFNYESKKAKSVEEAYQNALAICQDYGPSPEYPYLIEVLEKIAAASDGIDADEKALIDNFQRDLLAKFRKDLLDNKLTFRD